MRLVTSGLYLKSMKRWVPLFLFLSLMAIVAVLAIRQVSQKTVSGKIYPVSDVKKLLRRAPKYWSGRTILVRGNLYTITTYCTPFSGPQSHCRAGSVTQMLPALHTGWQYIGDRSHDLPPRVDTTRNLIVITSSHSHLGLSTKLSSFQLGPLLFVKTGGAVYRIRLLSVQSCKRSASSRPCPEAVVL
jgi:hypothetical protein